MKRKLMWITAFVPLVIFLGFYRRLPEQIPLNYDINGQASRFGSRNNVLLIGPLTILITALFELYIHFSGKRASDNRKKAVNKTNKNVLYIVIITLNIFYILMSVIMCIWGIKSVSSMKSEEMFNMLISFGMGIFFIISGNVMPKAKKNAAFGVRLSWTMKNDAVWARSNHFGGYVMMVSGFALIFGGLLLPGMWKIYQLLIVTAISTVIIIVKSYKIYKEEVSHEN